MNSGLIIFIIVWVINGLTLAFDAMLKWYWDAPTISERVWKHPIIGWLLIGVQGIGLMGLAYHLWVVPKRYH